MFPSRFFPARYFAPRYWPKVGSSAVVVPGPFRSVLYLEVSNQRSELSVSNERLKIEVSNVG